MEEPQAGCQPAVDAVQEKFREEHHSQVDIEHALVQDDPREWRKARKYIVVVMICAAALIAGLTCNLYTPALAEMKADLHATSGQVSLTLSLFILIQGGAPIFWSSVSEIRGRKASHTLALVYIVSISLCCLGSVVSACSKTIKVLIGMRCLQAAGSSAVVSIGAATLADLFEPVERGTMMGVYLCAPLLGPSIGPILGGILTQAFDWRATFWLLAIFTGLCSLSFIFFTDTFRQERSLTYQSVLKRLKLQEEKHAVTAKDAVSSNVAVAQGASGREVVEGEVKSETSSVDTKIADLEAQKGQVAGLEPVKQAKVTLRDMNPVGPMIYVLRRKNNVVIILASALLFAFEFSITYTASLTLANEYHYDALKIGLVLLAFGIGMLLGSLLGGRYSDHVLAKLKAKNGGISAPEMRLQSTMFAMLLFPPFVVGYGWVCEEHVHIAAVCVILFFAGFFAICIYSSTLAYIVDANTGRSSSAVACNSSLRGLAGFIATEIAVPLQNALGDGGLYSMWAGLMLVSETLILLVWWKGGRWREASSERSSAKI
ncbi:MFS general substrate transporter [Laetiporus sulphureus 93-53]|uniref:MFS general substrate transporter n=1 Tax=Laetiporus sulphureus 93-53 TaxID=1314785 RepID=A0A165HT47_9APHY|nr:MFS general substrate transporter [Laetiporus sulphureus 93-53]KZT12153.1 MFS general substrate transporter [Laetiporus sulphureus 93-53]